MFDPYHQWLGIHPSEQPVNYYRLLGLRDFENDPDVIASAADKSMSHVKSYSSGEYSKESQKLLNELATARVTLLKNKSEYDLTFIQDNDLKSKPAEIPVTTKALVVAAATVPLFLLIVLFAFSQSEEPPVEVVEVTTVEPVEVKPQPVEIKEQPKEPTKSKLTLPTLPVDTIEPESKEGPKEQESIKLTELEDVEIEEPVKEPVKKETEVIKLDLDSYREDFKKSKNIDDKRLVVLYLVDLYDGSNKEPLFLARDLVIETNDRDLLFDTLDMIEKKLDENQIKYKVDFLSKTNTVPNDQLMDYLASLSMLLQRSLDLGEFDQLERLQSIAKPLVYRTRDKMSIANYKAFSEKVAKAKKLYDDYEKAMLSENKADDDYEVIGKYKLLYGDEVDAYNVLLKSSSTLSKVAKLELTEAKSVIQMLELNQAWSRVNDKDLKELARDREIYWILEAFVSADNVKKDIVFNRMKKYGVSLLPQDIRQHVIESKNKYYLVVDHMYAWNDAVNVAKGYGGNLVSIKSQSDMLDVVNIMKSRKGSYWTSATDGSREGVWKWHDNSSVNPNLWKVRPANNKNLNCAIISANGDGVALVNTEDGSNNPVRHWALIEWDK